jgi:phage baseplate assembly protein W
VQWCVKAVLTERFAHVIYSTDYGSEIEQALKQPSRKAVEAELERVITEALLVDPRTEQVKDFAFEWEGDAVKVSFTAVPVVGPPERLEVVLNG